MAEPLLPDYSEKDFRLTDAPECDVIMKGGITSGVVYPYAMLEIATKYRFRSLGGTSAGAIAAAFAAAAEYARRNGRPGGFLLLKKYSDELPDNLLSLFQPHPELAPAVDLAKRAMAAKGIRPLLLGGAMPALPWALAGALLLAGASWLVNPHLYPTALAGLLGALLGGAFGAWRWARRNLVNPAVDALSRLPALNFGVCTGLTQPGSTKPALTDWVHRALQHIAFGDPDHPKPLTFGDLEGDDPERPQIMLRMVTTNLSMRRPHTLPRLGTSAGFVPEQWERLFPKPVMAHLFSVSKAWRRAKGVWLFPQERELPVVVAVRMSLSFPVLFSAVPMIIEDTELPAIVRSLGGKPYKRMRTAHFSDGGISSNFPIHMFDAPLPGRPTFAFSLEDLLWNPAEVERRVSLPKTAGEGMGVQIKEIRSLRDFAWQILSSAKDWQDQLLSEITGQRERIARIFLTDKEGGLNLDMPPELSRQLMRWGYEAGRKFKEGEFDFDEHRWRRLLVLYKHLQQTLDSIDRIWDGGFGDWYARYYPKVKSYKKLTIEDRLRIARDMEELLDGRDGQGAPTLGGMEAKLPRKSGVLKVAPRY